MIIAIALLIIAVSVIAELSIKAYRRERNLINIKDSLEMFCHPIIPFYSGGVRLNFLLDTGASNSLIDPNSLKNIKYELIKTDEQCSVSGISGDPIYFDLCALSMEYKDSEFSFIFGMMDISERFNEMTDGKINIDGVIGTDFLESYGYVIDFSDAVVYVK